VRRSRWSRPSYFYLPVSSDTEIDRTGVSRRSVGGALIDRLALPR